PAPAEGGAAGEVRHRFDVLRPHHAGVVDGDVHEKPVEIDVLLGVRVDQVVKMMSGDGQHRLAVELRVIEAVQEMNPARAGGGEANAETAGVLGITAGHEGGRLFMPDLDKTDALARLAQ